MDTYFDIGIATIFAREVLEASIIIGQYRMVVTRSPEWQEEHRQKEGLRAISVAAFWASLVAVLMILAVAIPLALLSRDLSEESVQIVEGVSKLVGSVCVLQLSLKIPSWLKVYPSKKGELDAGVKIREIYFNVAWNIWREVAECGAFLLPFFLGGQLKKIPLSALAGCFISLILGMGIYYGNKQLQNKFWLAYSMATITGVLSLGLFVGGCHLFEVVWGETKTIWEIKNEFWSHKEFPMTVIKPFGYSSSRTVLQCVAFWSWSLLAITWHVWKYKAGKKRAAQFAEDAESTSDDIELERGAVPEIGDSNFNTETTMDIVRGVPDDLALNQSHSPT